MIGKNLQDYARESQIVHAESEEVGRWDDFANELCGVDAASSGVDAVRYRLRSLGAESCLRSRTG